MQLTSPDDELVDRLRVGDEQAFAELVDRYSTSMLAVARTHVASREVAEDVVQDTWLALLKGIDGFEGRSSLRTWLFRVLVNIAKTRGVRERRGTPVAMSNTPDHPAVSPDRFQSDDSQRPGHWVRFPMPWRESPEHSLLAGEALDLVRHELARLPQKQRIVVSLRDVDGYDSDEVCALLDLTAANQRGPAAPRPGSHPPGACRRLRTCLVTGWDDVDFGGLTCRNVVELVTDHLEDRLDAGSRMRFERHVAACPGCARYLDQIREATLVLGRVTLDTISAKARDQLLDAFRSWRSGRPDPPD